jgi:hypothetical protein
MNEVNILFATCIRKSIKLPNDMYYVGTFSILFYTKQVEDMGEKRLAGSHRLYIELGK